MFKTSLSIVSGFAALVSFGAQAMPSTEDCLNKGLCAYVSPKGRVSCGKCPTPPRVMKVPAGTFAVCNDDSFESKKGGVCKGHGGVAMSLKPDPKEAADAKQ